MSTWILGVIVIGLLFTYVGMTSNKKIVDSNKRFTHADIMNWNGTETYKILAYDYPKDSPHMVKIWPDRSVNQMWPEMIQSSASSIRLYSKEN